MLKLCKATPEAVATLALLIRPLFRHGQNRLGTLLWQTFPIHLPRRVLSCKAFNFADPLTLKDTFLPMPPSKSGRCENEALVQDFPSKSESWRCENEALVRDVLQILKFQLCKARPAFEAIHAGALRPCFRYSRNRLGTVLRQTFPIHLPRRVLPCKTSVITVFRASANC